MKRLAGRLALRLAVWIFITALLTGTSAWAKPTTPEQARTVVFNWLGLDAVPLGSNPQRHRQEACTSNPLAGKGEFQDNQVPIPNGMAGMASIRPSP